LTRPLYFVGRFCCRHHYPVIALWLLATIVLVAAGQASGDKTNDNLTLPGTGSTKATDLLQDNIPEQANGNNPVVLEATAGKLTSPSNSKAVDSAVKRLRNTPHVISAVNPLGASGAPFLSKDKTVAYVPVILNLGPADLTEEEAQSVLDAADPAKAAGIEVSVGGYVGQQLSKPSTEISEAIGLTAAVIILLLAFGTATAMAMPIFSAVLGLACSLSIIRLLQNAIEVPSVSATLATMIGLGVGIDYALFIVTRHKQQLKAGMEINESIARATATSGGAVVFAGFTVVIALCSLAFAGIPLVSALGFTAAVAVVVAVLAAVTLLPAMLGALGPRIDSLRVQLGRTHPDDHQPHGWLRWAEGVSSRPWPAVIVSVLVLVVLALPLRDLTLGQSDNGAMPKSTQVRKSYDGLTKGFGVGTNGPLLIAVSAGKPLKPDQSQLNKVNSQQQQLNAQKQQIEQQGVASGLTQQEAQTQAQQQTAAQQKKLNQDRQEASNPASDPQLTKLQQDISKTPDVQSVSPPTLDKAAKTAVFTVIAKSAPSSDRTVDLVNDLRDNVIPKALKGTDLNAYVGGQTAGYIDLADRISAKLASMIAIVVGLSFLVLLLAFRSLLVPVKAAVMNLLSVAAAYGVVTAVFQKGWGAELIGLDHAIPIVSFVPLLMFAILFGLSMDYEVFLMSQMSERYRQGSEPAHAVVEGLANTGRVITSAAMIMVCVFASFVLNGNPVVKEFGVGLAVAIAIDSTLVRCLLVPAVMVLLRGRAWWMPGLLERTVPHISIEDESFFAERDAATASAAGKAPSGG
jgi:putative drug exporter of the RND superfamily